MSASARSPLFTFSGVCLLLVAALFCHGQSRSEAPARRQAADTEKDPAVILELGAATNWNFGGGAATFAPNLAAEKWSLNLHPDQRGESAR